MKTDSREYGLKNGYSPIAAKTLCIDFDGTLYPWGELFSYDPPMLDAVETVNRFKKAGFTIVIFTSRLSPTWLKAEGLDEADQRAYIAEVLKRDGIPYDGMTCEKIPALAYVDDRAVLFEGDNWRQIGRGLVDRYGG